MAFKRIFRIEKPSIRYYVALASIAVLAFAIMVLLSYFYSRDIEQEHLLRETNLTLSYLGALYEADQQEIKSIVGFVGETVGEMLEQRADVDVINAYMTRAATYVREQLQVKGFVGLFVMYTLEDKYFDDPGFNGAFPDMDWDAVFAAGYVPTDRLWYQLAETAGEQTLSTIPYVNITNGKVTISVVRNVYASDGERIAIVSLDISLEGIYLLSDYLTSSEGFYWMVLDKNMNLLFHPNQELIGRSIRDMNTGLELLSDELEQEGYVTERRIRGHDEADCIVSFMKLENGYYVGVAVEEYLYYNSLHRITWFLGLVGAALAIVLSYVLISVAMQRAKAEEHSRLLLEGMPLGAYFWTSDNRIIAVNEALAKIFGLSKGQDVIDKFGELSPEFQPDGRRSTEKGGEYVKRAFDEGFSKCEWLHIGAGGEEIPCEVSFIRLKYRDDYVVATYYRDLREHKAMLKKLEDEYIRRAEADAASKAKSTFLATVSHEIRTPMNTILGIAEIQLDTGTLTPETEDAFTQIYEAGDLLLNIVNDILDISKIEAGKIEIKPIKYDVPSLIIDSVQLNKLRYESKPIELNLEIDENTPQFLLGDELRIKQILNNILSNALKYTDKGEVKLSVWSEDRDTQFTTTGSKTIVGTVALDRPRATEAVAPTENDVYIIFKITDTGYGMTGEQVRLLFTDYTRFNVDANRSTTGTGLGLSITKRLVDLMNGEISVSSVEGSGTIVTVKLPQTRADDSVCGPGLSSKWDSYSVGSKPSRKEQFTRKHMPDGKVLVVDDIRSNLYVTRGMLLPYGLNIETVESGFEAIKKIESGDSYDIIFMDHMMPKMDGIEATKIIRNLGYTGCIIALTANALVGQAEMFIQNGFNGFISKPIDTRELNSVLNDHIGSLPQS